MRGRAALKEQKKTPTVNENVETSQFARTRESETKRENAIA